MDLKRTFMKIQLRPYQRECIDKMFYAMHQDWERNLVALPTAAGKTIIFSNFTKEVYERYGHLRKKIRICIVAHREPLIKQAHEKLLGVWPESIKKIGLACATYDDDIDIDSEIIIGSIQTIISRLRRQEIEPFDIIIIDEGHRIPPVNRDSTYKELLEITAALSPRRKVFAFTATPYQLGHGYIYGDQCKPGNGNWFDKMLYNVPMDNLIEDGFLSPYRIKQAVDIGPELRGVPMVGGEYKNDVLGDIMCQFVETAVNVHQKYGEGRKKCAAFCVNIPHAIALAEAFNQRDIPARAVHSKISMAERRGAFELFSEGKIEVLCSVDALIEGWDEPSIDLVLMARPTKSTMIYVQQGGRGLRLFPGKKDLLTLDIADNLRNHGFLSEPIVSIPGSTKPGDPPLKICPECSLAMRVSASQCEECGYIFPKKKYREPGNLTLEEVDRRVVKYTREYPTLARIKNIEIIPNDRYVMMQIHFRDPLTGKKQTSNFFINLWKFQYPQFAEEWESITNIKKTPKNIEEACEMLSQILWPKAGYFHKENKNGSRWANLCGWHQEGWDGIFPEIQYNQEPPASPFLKQKKHALSKKLAKTQ